MFWIIIPGCQPIIKIPRFHFKNKITEWLKKLKLVHTYLIWIQKHKCVPSPKERERTREGNFRSAVPPPSTPPWECVPERVLRELDLRLLCSARLPLVSECEHLAWLSVTQSNFDYTRFVLLVKIQYVCKVALTFPLIYCLVNVCLNETLHQQGVQKAKIITIYVFYMEQHSSKIPQTNSEHILL